MASDLPSAPGLPKEIAVQYGLHQPVALGKQGFWAAVRRFGKAWWHNKYARFATISVVVLAIGIPAAVPHFRYAVLNTAGVRSSASVIVLDSATSLPLKNVSVSLDGISAQTNREGQATLRNLKLGPHQLHIGRVAFAPYTQKVVVGWGSNPLGSFPINAVGVQYVVHVTDYLSGSLITGAEAESAAVNALSDKEGKITLTPDSIDTTDIVIQVRAAGYRSETLTLKAVNTTTAASLALVPAAKHAYVTKQDGKQQLFATDLDGKNQKILLDNLGDEAVTNSVVVNPESSQVVLVSTRNGTHNSDGFVLRSLAFIPVSGGKPVTVDNSEHIQLIEWTANKLVYRTTVAGLSAANSSRNRLIAYDPVANAKMQLANANDFTAAFSRQGFLYYAPSGNDPNAKLGFFRVKPDGSNREQLLDQEVWGAASVAYDSLLVQTPAGWHKFTFDLKQAAKSNPPSSSQNRFYVADAQSKRVSWVQQQDGKTTVIVRDLVSKGEKTLASGTGILSVRWAGDKALVYRQQIGNELIDFAISPDGGQPHKIGIVLATNGYSAVY